MASKDGNQHQLSAQIAQPSESGDGDAADTAADNALDSVDDEEDSDPMSCGWTITGSDPEFPMGPEEVKEALRKIQKADDAWQKAIEKRLEALEAAENAGLDEIDMMLLEFAG
ncbi:MAG: hypothetical protein Q9179_002654 [Wetmoreana sp. 5 TL-2023]